MGRTLGGKRNSPNEISEANVPYDIYKIPVRRKMEISSWQRSAALDLKSSDDCGTMVRKPLPQLHLEP